MKIRVFISCVLLSACVKESIKDSVNIASQSNILADSDNSKIPITDLGSNTFMGYTGGLYPGGANEPSGKYAKDLLNVSKSIVPIDTLGNASPDGKIVFISLGASTGGHNMKALTAKTVDNPETNPYLKLFTCNNGKTDASLVDIVNTSSVYWQHVNQVVKGSKSSHRQIQVIYLESDDTSKIISWPTRPNMVKNNLEACSRILKQQFPNLKIIYLLARTKTFGSSALWNREPSPYYFGWACKWAIEDQINGVPGTEYKGRKAVAPMLAWGFYQWADSLPRQTDQFYWRSTETADGLHATAEGQDTLSTRFQRFLLSDKYAKNWYANK